MDRESIIYLNDQLLQLNIVIIINLNRNTRLAKEFFEIIATITGTSLGDRVLSFTKAPRGNWVSNSSMRISSLIRRSQHCDRIENILLPLTKFLCPFALGFRVYDDSCKICQLK